MFGLNQMGLNLFGLLYRMISKVLSLLKLFNGDFIKSRALYWAREGRYSNSLQALNSFAGPMMDDDDAFRDLLTCHPPSPCPDLNSNSTVMVDESYPAYVGFQRVLVQGLPNFRLSISLTVVSLLKKLDIKKSTGPNGLSALLTSGRRDSSSINVSLLQISVA